MTIKACHCQHEFQDKTHGRGMRVHTTDKEGRERCTVCSGKARKMARIDSHAKEWQPVFSTKPRYPWPAAIPAV